MIAGNEPGEVAVAMDETAPAGERRYYDDYDRRLAAEIVAMLVNTRSDAQRALAVVDIIMNLPLPAPPSEPRLPDAA
jgi:hypothetical protein